MQPRKPSDAVIDVQGFRGLNNKFIIKELAVCYNLNEFQHFLIQPPYHFKTLPKKQQNTAVWLFKNHHGLSWNEGSITFESVKNFLNENIKNATVYVKGSQKKKVINKLLTGHIAINDLNKLGAPTLPKLYEKYSSALRCPTHDGICALQNVLVLRNYIDFELRK